jgi:hypothetical protein
MNQPLVQMPSRTIIEWRGVALNGDDRFISEYLESFAQQQQRQRKSLYSLLSRCCNTRVSFLCRIWIIQGEFW